jgi:hypothetical protein
MYYCLLSTDRLSYLLLEKNVLNFMLTLIKWNSVPEGVQNRSVEISMLKCFSLVF